MLEISLSPAIERNGAVRQIEPLDPRSLPLKRILDLPAPPTSRGERVGRTVLQCLWYRADLAPVRPQERQRDFARPGNPDDRGAVTDRQMLLAVLRQVVAR